MNSRHDHAPDDNALGAQAYIVHPDIAHLKDGHVADRDLGAVLEEVEGLVRAIGLDVAVTRVVKPKVIQPGAFLGKGVRAEIAEEIAQIEPEIVVFNDQLSPVQQRNLEREWNAKVIDRTGLILEIFGERAQTKEGRLQVELAALEYQRSRLVRSWTHLERQRGGAGFMGGPGERQIELDRRIIAQRVVKIKKELSAVVRTRELGRLSRERVPFPIVSLVGYTNAGKSTLFNTLTGAGVFAEDLPFATLDPTMRRMKLPNGQDVILADTVGFISDLPTHLVAAFRATLEQVVYADVIVHVMDVSQPNYQAQKHDVIKILKDLGVDYESDARILEVWNKMDALSQEDADDMLAQAKRQSKIKALPVSALHGDGVGEMLAQIAHVTSYGWRHAQFLIPQSDGRAIAWLYEHGQVVGRSDTAEGAQMDVVIDAAHCGKLKEYYGYEPLDAS